MKQRLSRSFPVITDEASPFPYLEEMFLDIERPWRGSRFLFLRIPPEKSPSRLLIAAHLIYRPYS